MKKEKLSKEEKSLLKQKKREENRAKGKNFFSEFKTFITRGNIIDMSIGVIVGTAFSKVTSTLTNKIFMPWIAFILGDINIDEIKTILRPQELNEKGEIIVTEIALMWGEFMQVIIDFILIAFVIFTTVKIINRIHLNFKKAKEKIEVLLEKNGETECQKVAEEAPLQNPVETLEVKSASDTNELLAEIRDLLKMQLEKEFKKE